MRTVGPRLPVCIGIVGLLGVATLADAQTQRENPTAVLIQRLNAAHAGKKLLGRAGSDGDTVSNVTGFYLTSGVPTYQYPDPGSLPDVLLIGDTQWGYNCSSVTQSATYSFAQSNQDSTTHSFSLGFTEGIKLTWKAKPPVGFEFAAEVSFTSSQTMTDSTTTTTTASFSQTYPIQIPAKKKVGGQMVLTEKKVASVPFTLPVVASGPVSVLVIAGLNTGTYNGLLEDLLSVSDRTFTLAGTVASNVTTASQVYWSQDLDVNPATDCIRPPSSAAQAARPGTQAAQPPIHMIRVPSTHTLLPGAHVRPGGR
jgi:toxin ETX/toxin MTX2